MRIENPEISPERVHQEGVGLGDSADLTELGGLTRGIVFRVVVREGAPRESVELVGGPRLGRELPPKLREVVPPLAERGKLDPKGTDRLFAIVDQIERDFTRAERAREGGTEADLVEGLRDVYCRVETGKLTTKEGQLEAIREATDHRMTLTEHQLGRLLRTPDQIRPHTAPKGEKKVRAGAKNTAVEAVAKLFGASVRTIYGHVERWSSAPAWPRAWHRIAYALRIHNLSDQEAKTVARELFDPAASFDGEESQTSTRDA